MNYELSWRTAKLWLAASLILLSLWAMIAIVAQRRVSAQSVNEKVVTVFDGQQEQTFVTSAKTVKEALSRAEISVGTSDAVEPRMETELVAKNYNVNIYRARPVVIVDGSTRVNVMSPHKSARQVVERAGIELYPEDEAVIARVNSIETEAIATEKISIDRATPITMIIYGQRADIRTQSSTVSELVKEKSIVLGANDHVSVEQTSAVTAGMTVEIWRDGKQTISEEQAVSFPTRQIKDGDRDLGFREVRSVGKNGKKVVTYEIEMKNGKEVARREVQVVVTEQPVEQVELVGTKRKGGSPAENRILGQQMMLDYGFAADQWPCLDKLFTKESGWNQYADNPSSDAYGIPQALPGSKMGAGWESDPEVQIRWGLGYVKGRYGTPCGAWNAFLTKGWY